MKKAFIALLIAVACAVILSITLAKKNGDSPGPSRSQAGRKNSVKDPSGTEKELVDLANIAAEEPEEPIEAAEQILSDISDANVPESTEDLRSAFSRLNKLCERAVETRDAMLSVKFANKQDHSVSDTKGPENGSD